MQRYALFVTGPPASGKSSIVEPLARALPHFALLQKDPLKEALYDALHEGGPQAATASRRLSDVARRMLWALAPGCPRVILEANFRTLDPQERARFQSLDANKLEVHCACPFEIAMQRFASRAANRHPAHTVQTLTSKIFRESQSPFGLSPVIEVDTTNPIDLPRLLQQIHTHWPEL
ncbi:MAG TPA: AAA family ATPase [Acidobacteriaceae bacterium]|nr:AAA family ATPase [Acidobacteriaceae bacterium]